MTRITEKLVRSRAEHNNLEISTLEEVSLHQQDIEKIEHIDKWCKELKILYLQSNLIPKIENVSKLKKLEYLNLALNNVERVENLEGCESLKKLDLTVNFVGELTSIECLKDLHHFKEIYLTGNPCAEYDGYRDYVICTLCRLQYLDGREVEKSERISAMQNYEETRRKILQQQETHRKKRIKEKEEARMKAEKKKNPKEKKAGFDGRWYTDINEGDGKNTEQDENQEEEEDDREKGYEHDKEFWDEECAFTPESRVEVHEQIKKQKQREEKKDPKEEKKPRRLFSEDGRPFNINENKIDFSLIDDEEHNSYVLDLAVFRHMDTSLIDVDVQTNYVRVVMKGKIFQLHLDQDVNADSSSAKRSQTTGHLLITMPKVKQVIKPAKIPAKATKETKDDNKENKVSDNNKRKTEEKLEVDESARKTVDVCNIVKEKPDKVVPPLGYKPRKVEERANSEDFIDDPDVPPLD